MEFSNHYVEKIFIILRKQSIYSRPENRWVFSAGTQRGGIGFRPLGILIDLYPNFVDNQNLIDAIRAMKAKAKIHP